ncbi:MAG TPA: hypothetical protein VLA09_00490, partial [Longimicrobiales bacterium]|nr:hypothetical protein [Longimicrobiales bacterium]
MGNRRRRRGRLLLGLFTLQLLAMPLGACAQGAEGHEAAGHVLGDEPVDVHDHDATMDDATAHVGHQHGDGPDSRDCVALSSCSVPVVTAAPADESFSG